MTSVINVITIDPVTDHRWSEFIQTQPSTLFHSSKWINVIEKTYGLQIDARLLLDSSGIPNAGLLYSRIADQRGPRISMIPFSDFCDPLVDTISQWRELIDDLIDEDVQITVRSLHNTISHVDERFEKRHRARWHGLDLSGNEDEQWSRIDPSARRAIRKAEKSGLTTRLADSEADVRLFFDMHLGVRKHKYKLLAQPYDFFRNLWKTFHDSGHDGLMLAFLDNEPVGGVMYLEYGDTLYYKYSASHRSLQHARPTDLLIWEGIKLARERGLRHLDFGLSDWDQDGLVRYKRKFASHEGEISFLQFTPSQYQSLEHREFGALLGELTTLLTDESVPDVVTERGGNLLYRYFA